MNHRNYWYRQQFGKVRDIEKIHPRTCHPKHELWLQIEKDTANKPIYKLVPATAKDLEWDCFNGKSRFEKLVRCDTLKKKCHTLH